MADGLEAAAAGPSRIPAEAADKASLSGEIVVIPLTAYLSRVFSFRNYIVGSTFFLFPAMTALPLLRLHPIVVLSRL
jgi:hypothetical protein